mmetsp:Transcript_33298/g.69986  ORF Transcript_33298/g.69986 Transcript_33298/m.69986 type:complete len:229 (-) Transcript_33298:389-1075(-)
MQLLHHPLHALEVKPRRIPRIEPPVHAHHLDQRVVPRRTSIQRHADPPPASRQLEPLQTIVSGMVAVRPSHDGEHRVGGGESDLGRGELHSRAYDASLGVHHFVQRRDGKGDGFHDVAALAREGIEEFGNVPGVFGHAECVRFVVRRFVRVGSTGDATDNLVLLQTSLDLQSIQSHPIDDLFLHFADCTVRERPKMIRDQFQSPSNEGSVRLARHPPQPMIRLSVRRW